MSEKFAFQKLTRDGRTVDRDKSLVSSRAVTVNRTSDHLFPRTALSGNQHRGTGRSHLLDQLEGFLHRGGFSDDPIETISAADFLPEGSHFLLEVVNSKSLFDHDLDFLDVERLPEIVECAQFHGLDRCLHRAVSGQHHHHCVGFCRLDFP